MGRIPWAESLEGGEDSHRAARFGTRSENAMELKTERPRGTEQEKYPPPSRAPKANNLDTVPKVIVIIICDVQIQRGKPKRNN